MLGDAPTIGPQDEVVTLPAVARELGRARNTVWVWALRGRLPARCIGNRWVVRRVDLDAFKRTIGQESPAGNGRKESVS